MQWVVEEAARMRPDQDICLLMSGRGDKDMITVAKTLGVELLES